MCWCGFASFQHGTGHAIRIVGGDERQKAKFKMIRARHDLVLLQRVRAAACGADATLYCIAAEVKNSIRTQFGKVPCRSDVFL